METTKVIGCGIGCLSLIIFSSGIIFLGIAFAWWQSSQSFIETAERVEGVVVEVRENRNRDGNTLYSPVVEFTDHAGQLQKFQSSVSSYPQRYFVGDKVQVLYAKDNPNSAVIDNWWYHNLTPLILLVIGIIEVVVSVFLVIVAFFVYRYRRKDNVVLNATPALS